MFSHFGSIKVFGVTLCFLSTCFDRAGFCSALGGDELYVYGPNGLVRQHFDRGLFLSGAGTPGDSSGPGQLPSSPYNESPEPAPFGIVVLDSPSFFSRTVSATSLGSVYENRRKFKQLLNGSEG
jgi:hypothetical protein